MSDSNGNGDGIKLPKWFLWVVSTTMGLFLAIFAPWAAWLTSSVITIGVRIEAATALNQRIDSVSSRVEKVDQTAALNSLRITEVERRLADVEKTK